MEVYTPLKEELYKESINNAQMQIICCQEEYRKLVEKLNNEYIKKNEILTRQMELLREEKKIEVDEMNLQKDALCSEIDELSTSSAKFKAEIAKIHKMFLEEKTIESRELVTRNKTEAATIRSLIAELEKRKKVIVDENTGLYKILAMDKKKFKKHCEEISVDRKAYKKSVNSKLTDNLTELYKLQQSRNKFEQRLHVISSETELRTLQETIIAFRSVMTDGIQHIRTHLRKPYTFSSCSIRDAYKCVDEFYTIEIEPLEIRLCFSKERLKDNVTMLARLDKKIFNSKFGDQHVMEKELDALRQKHFLEEDRYKKKHILPLKTHVTQLESRLALMLEEKR